MKIIILIIIVIFCCALSKADKDEFIFNKKNKNISSVMDVFRYLKKNARTWKPSITPISLLSRSELSRRMGIIMTPNLLSEFNRKGDDISDIITGVGEIIPESYDLRKQYPQCKSIRTIKDQSTCGSCWAVTSASVFTDRSCINTNGSTTTEMSAQDLLTCCYYCKPMNHDGCDGGYIENAIRYMMRFGIVTGGSYGSKEGCKPYAIPPCTKNPCIKAKAGVCHRYCTNGNYNKSYAADKKKENTVYQYLRSDQAIQSCILRRGSAILMFLVYKDFTYYTSGIYQRTSGEKLEYHAVRCIGWGVENGVKYWLAANSWGTNWGEKGFFKIRRGVKELKENEIKAIC